MAWTVRVLQWREFQHYKDREPPWIKLHRKLIHKPGWRRLRGSAAKLLVDVWVLAAGNKEGELDMGIADIAYHVRRPVPAVLIDLRSLAECGFLEVGKQMLADASVGQASADPETETEAEQRQSRGRDKSKSVADATVRIPR